MDEKETLRGFIQEHVNHTGSTVGQKMLNDFESSVKDFVKVYPHDYKRVLEERAMKESAAA